MRFIILLLPWLELFTLIELGVKTSALTALIYVLATFLLGLGILQRQGRGIFERFRQAPQGRMLGPELLLEDMAMGFAGLLLMIPGMITDLFALMIMVGPLRRRLARTLLPPQAQVRTDGRLTIEGVYQHVEDEKRRNIL